MPYRLASTALLAVTLGVLTPAPASAGIRQIEVDGSSLLAFGQKLEAAGNKRRAGEVYRVLAGDPDANVRAEARFRLAKILVAEGKRTEAAVLLRHVIDDHPKAAAPRLELAGLLHQIGDESGALRELRTLGTLNLPLNVARFVDRMSASLRASRPFSFQLELALAPDSNINRATTSNTLGTVFGDFDFSEDSKARSGVGAAVRGFVQGRLSLSRDAALQAHASLDASLYREHAFNDISFDVAAGPEFHLGSVRLAAEAGAGQQWYGMHAFQRSLRLSGSAWIKVDSASQLRLDSALRWADNRFNNLQDGRGLSLAARYERSLSPRLTVSLGVGADRFSAKEDAYSTRSWTLAANAYRDVGRTTVDIGAEFGRLKADDRLAILPQARDDRLTRVHLGAVFRQLTVAGFAPTMRFTVERNRSNVEYYDYKRTRTEFGVSRAF
jgi:tetratricopeptide (TPR) repeat protein